MQNRLFVIIAVGLIGLICIGVLGVSGVAFLLTQSTPETVAIVTPTQFPPTFTPTPTLTPTPTNTSEPTQTATWVVDPQGGAQEAAQPQTPGPGGTPVNTLVIQPLTPSPTSTPAEIAAVPDEITEEGAPPSAIPPSGGVLNVEQTGVVIWSSLLVLVMLIGGVLHYYRSPRRL